MKTTNEISVDKFGVLNHNIRCAVSHNGSAIRRNPYLNDIMVAGESATAEHAALVAVAEANEKLIAVLDACNLVENEDLFAAIANCRGNNRNLAAVRGESEGGK